MKNYKEINELFWKAVELERTNPEMAKQLYSRIEELESAGRKR